MQIRPRRFAVARVRFVITAAGTQRPDPAGAAIGFLGDVMPIEKRRLRLAIDPVAYGPELVRVRSREPVAQRDVAIRRNAKETETGAAGIGLAHAFVDFLQRLLDVGEAV